MLRFGELKGVRVCMVWDVEGPERRRSASNGVSVSCESMMEEVILGLMAGGCWVLGLQFMMTKTLRIERSVAAPMLRYRSKCFRSAGRHLRGFRSSLSPPNRRSPSLADDSESLNFSPRFIASSELMRVLEKPTSILVEEWNAEGLVGAESRGRQY